MTVPVFVVLALLALSLTSNVMLLIKINDVRSDVSMVEDGMNTRLSDSLKRYKEMTEETVKILNNQFNLAENIISLQYDAVNQRQTILEEELDNLKAYTYESLNELLKEKRIGNHVEV